MQLYNISCIYKRKDSPFLSFNTHPNQNVYLHFQMDLYNQIIERKKSSSKTLAVLIDPNGLELRRLEYLMSISLKAKVDYFFVGGSTLKDNQLNPVIEMLNSQSQIPIILFPGSPNQIHNKADAILLLSLISGRNPDLLIGQHVDSSVTLHDSGLEIIPTGYLLIEGGKTSSVQRVSQTTPINSSDIETTIKTALAGQQLGLKLIYLEAGSGASIPVSKDMISAVSDILDIPLIVGGGIRSANQAKDALIAGADIIVVGNAFENNPDLIPEIADAVHSFNVQFA